MIEVLAVLLVAGGVWWWRRSARVERERDTFFATMELRKSLEEFPHGTVTDHIDAVAYKLVVFRPRMSPAEAKAIAVEAAHHIAVGSNAWKPLAPTAAKPDVERRTLSSRDEPKPPTTSTISTTSIVLIVVLLFMGFLALVYDR
jgi:hypothetical protein